MTKRLDPKSRGVLTFRPQIEFVEPDPVGEEPTPVPERPQLEDVLAEKKSLITLAKAINTLATAIQAKADIRAKDVEIALDPVVDASTVAAMRRLFPDDDPTKINYQQYRQCKDDQRAFGEEIGRRGALNRDEVKEASDKIAEGKGVTDMGGFGTKDAIQGLLRPELDPKAQIIPPIPIEEFQISLICILINFIWKNFLKPFLIGASFPVGLALLALPNKICDDGAGGIEIPGLFILGGTPPSFPPVPTIPTSLI